MYISVGRLLHVRLRSCSSMLCTSQELRARRVLMLLYVCPRSMSVLVLLYILSSKLRIFFFSGATGARARGGREGAQAREGEYYPTNLTCCWLT
jgi:hypothetical protein